MSCERWPQTANFVEAIPSKEKTSGNGAARARLPTCGPPLSSQLEELERRFRLADRRLQEAERTVDLARKQLASNPVSDKDAENYRTARRNAKDKLKTYEAANEKLDQIDNEITRCNELVGAFHRQVARKKFFSSPIGIGILCSGEVAVLLLIAGISMIKIPVAAALGFVVLIAAAAVSLTIILTAARKRSIEPQLEYLASEIERAERKTTSLHSERSAAEEVVRQTTVELNRADRICDDRARRLQPMVRFDDAESELENARSRFDDVRSAYENAQTEWRLRLLRRNWRDMRGVPFEQFVEEVFNCLGYQTERTKASGDQGIDVIATKNGKRWGIQCKGYTDNVGNGAVQEAHTGRTIYNCDQCMVVTNSGFTRAAQEAAHHTGCVLVAGTDIPELIRGEYRL